MAQQGSPPRRSPRRPEDDQSGHQRAARSRRARLPERPRAAPPGWQVDAFASDDTDAELPTWAEPVARQARTRRRAAPPDPYAGGYAGEVRTAIDEGAEWLPDAAGPGPAGSRIAARRRGRAAATRLRKSRRRVYRLSAVGIVICVIGALIAVLVTRSSPKPTPYVTTLLPGEFKSVPSACGVSQAVLAQYLPGSGRTTTNQFSGATQSQCSFTIDAKPVFRLLEVTAQAYQPFAAASGNGSASRNAADSFTVKKAALAQPPKKSPLSAAVITPLAKLGQQAFAAYQREKAGGIVSDLVTVVVRDRNVLITAELSAQETQGFGQTPTATLQAGATAAAKDMLVKLRAQPTA